MKICPPHTDIIGSLKTLLEAVVFSLRHSAAGEDRLKKATERGEKREKKQKIIKRRRTFKKQEIETQRKLREERWAITDPAVTAPRASRKPHKLERCLKRFLIAL